MGSAPGWAVEARDRAAAALAQLPALTGTEEDWRFTPPADLGMNGDTATGGAASGEVSLPATAGRAARLAFADGAPAPAELIDLPEGVIVAELGEALASHDDLVRDRLYSLAGFDDRPGAINAAGWDAGTFVYVPRGVEVTLPIEAVLTGAPDASSAAPWWWWRRARRPR